MTETRTVTIGPEAQIRHLTKLVAFWETNSKILEQDLVDAQNEIARLREEKDK